MNKVKEKKKSDLTLFKNISVRIGFLKKCILLIIGRGD